jgi:hypothetical protein
VVLQNKYSFSLLLIAVILSGCTKPIIHNLPSLVTETPESREFFGCRINGIPYSPASAQSVQGRCYYGSVYSGDMGWVFQINGDRRESDCKTFSVGITLDSTVLKQGKTYSLGKEGLQKNFGSYFITAGCWEQRVELYSNDSIPGQVTITEYDPDKRVVTGTFSFVVLDKFGNVYRISDGIFDRHYIN